MLLKMPHMSVPPFYQFKLIQLTKELGVDSTPHFSRDSTAERLKFYLLYQLLQNVLESK